MTHRWLVALLLTFAMAIAAAGEQSTKRVLLLHSFGPDFGDVYSKDLRDAFDRELPGQVEVFDQWLVSARFTAPDEPSAFVQYLHTLFADHPLDLIISFGAPAANFLQTHRQDLFPNTPELLADVEQRRVPAAKLKPNVTVVASSISVPVIVEDILRVLPHTTTLAVVIGNSSLEQYWVGQIRDAMQPYRDRLTVTFLNDLPFDEILKRAATLPPHSAIFYALLSPAVVGIPEDEDLALTQLHAAANAPIFSYDEGYLGKGIVGGPLISTHDNVKQASNVAVRILRGESASAIKTPTLIAGRPQYDWRELRRWHISTSSLPKDSLIRFVETSVWEQYRWQLFSVALVVLLQTALILGLLYERRRRHSAENVALQRLAELARLNRLSAVGELSASIVHELGQPLAAILANSETAHLILGSETPDIDELRGIVSNIKRDDHRAGEVITRLRRMLTKAPIEAQDVNLNDTVEEVFEFLSSLASAREIILCTSFDQPAPHVWCDQVQLQQVILNLLLNAIDAMKDTNGRQRTIVGHTALLDHRFAEVSIEDSGPGIPAGKEEEIFRPFFTTKESGMGMGLSIARTIVENSGGRITAANGARQGAVFRFTLPLSKAVQHQNAGMSVEAPPLPAVNSSGAA